MFEITCIILAILLFYTIYSTLEKTPFLFGKNIILPSICMAILCMIGLHKMVMEAGISGHIGFLLPYATLAISIILLVILKILSRLFTKKDHKRKERYL